MSQNEFSLITTCWYSSRRSGVFIVWRCVKLWHSHCPVRAVCSALQFGRQITGVSGKLQVRKFCSSFFLPGFRRLVVWFSLLRLWIDSRPVHDWPVADEVAIGQVVPLVLQFAPSLSFKKLHIFFCRPRCVGSIINNFCVLHNTVEHNCISSSSTLGLQLHVSVLYVGHLQVVTWLSEQLYKMCGVFF